MIRPEMGKRYRTRDGSVKAVKKYHHSSHFMVFSGELDTDLWDRKGLYLTEEDIDAHPLDLMECIGESNE